MVSQGFPYQFTAFHEMNGITQAGWQGADISFFSLMQVGVLLQLCYCSQSSLPS